MVWLNLKFYFKIVIISIQKSFLLLILIPFLSGNFHSYSNSIFNSFPFLLSIPVKKSFPFPFLFQFPLMEISLIQRNKIAYKPGSFGTQSAALSLKTNGLVSV